MGGGDATQDIEQQPNWSWVASGLQEFSGTASCLRNVTLSTAGVKKIPVSWKPTLGTVPSLPGEEGALIPR